MADREFPGDVDSAQSGAANATRAFDIDTFETSHAAERAFASDGDGAMVGRVLIYASIIVVVIAVTVWKQFV
jgi:hypothetical protein